MDFRSPYPYFFMAKGIIRSYPSLVKNITTEVAIIGAGITDALVTYQLNKKGVETIFDRRHTGMCSTAASTGLLQYLPYKVENLKSTYCIPVSLYLMKTSGIKTVLSGKPHHLLYISDLQMITVYSSKERDDRFINAGNFIRVYFNPNHKRYDYRYTKQK